MSLPLEIQTAVTQLDLGFRSETLSAPEVPATLTATVLAGGKRVRPTLCFLMSRLLGVPTEKVAPFARAAEFVHAASLAHDDVIDNATERRKRPTVNAITSNAQAVLAGDFLLGRVVSEVAAQGNLVILKELAQTVEDLSCGEWLQESIAGRMDVSEQELLRIAQLKTASLIAWCCKTPARVGAFPEKTVKRCEDFGNAVGLAFQIVDDVIDFEETSEKPLAQDLRNGYLNLVTREILNQNPELVKPLTQWVESKSDPATFRLPWTLEQLENAKEAVRKKAEAQIQLAREALTDVMKDIHPEAGAYLASVLDFNAIFAFLGGRTH